MNYKKRGALIREAREKKGLTQEELGNLLNYSHNTIYVWEKGLSQPSDYNVLIKLANILDLSPVDIIYGEKNTNEELIALGYFKMKKKYFIRITSLIIVFLLFIIISGTYIYNKYIKGQVSTYSIYSTNDKYPFNGYLFVSNEVNILYFNKIDDNSIEDITLYYLDNKKEKVIFKGTNTNYQIENINKINEYNLKNIENKKLYLLINNDIKVTLLIDRRYINYKITNNNYKEQNQYPDEVKDYLIANGFVKKSNYYLKEVNNTTIKYRTTKKDYVVTINKGDYIETITKKGTNILYEKIGHNNKYEKKYIVNDNIKSCNKIDYEKIDDIISCLNYLDKYGPK